MLLEVASNKEVILIRGKIMCLRMVAAAVMVISIVVEIKSNNHTEGVELLLNSTKCINSINKERITMSRGHHHKRTKATTSRNMNSSAISIIGRDLLHHTMPKGISLQGTTCKTNLKVIIIEITQIKPKIRRAEAAGSMTMISNLTQIQAILAIIIEGTTLISQIICE